MQIWSRNVRTSTRTKPQVLASPDLQEVFQGLRELLKSPEDTAGNAAWAIGNLCRDDNFCRKMVTESATVPLPPTPARALGALYACQSSWSRSNDLNLLSPLSACWLGRQVMRSARETGHEHCESDCQSPSASEPR